MNRVTISPAAAGGSALRNLKPMQPSLAAAGGPPAETFIGIANSKHVDVVVVGRRDRGHREGGPWLINKC